MAPVVVLGTLASAVASMTYDMVALSVIKFYAKWPLDFAEVLSFTEQLVVLRLVWRVRKLFDLDTF